MKYARLAVAFVLTIAFFGCGQNKATSIQPVIATEAQTVSNPSSKEPEPTATSTLIEQCRKNGERSLSLKTATADDLNSIAELADLEVLEIYRSEFEPAELQSIEGLLQIKRLRLEDFAATDASVDVLSKFSELQVLNLPSSRITDDGFRRLLSALPKLWLLRIGSPQISDNGIASLRQSPELRFLHLIGVPLTDDGLKTLHGMPDLESLYIDGDNATDEGIRDLLKANPGLHFHRNQSHVAEDPNADGH